MNKPIQKLQEALRRAIENRDRCETKYNAHSIIVEGHRETLHQLEDLNTYLLNELQESNKAVSSLNKALAKEVEKFHNPPEEEETIPPGFMKLVESAKSFINPNKKYAEVETTK